MRELEAVLDPANYAEGTVLDLAGPLSEARSSWTRSSPPAPRGPPS